MVAAYAECSWSSNNYLLLHAATVSVGLECRVAGGLSIYYKVYGRPRKRLLHVIGTPVLEKIKVAQNWDL